MPQNKNFYDAWRDLQEDDYAEVMRKNDKLLKVGIWIAIIGGIILFLVLLPTILNHTAHTIEASKRVGKAIKS